MPKNDKQRQRSDWASAIINVVDGKIDFMYDFADDTVSFGGAEPGSLKTERSYERDSGKPKIVSSIPATKRIPFDAERSIMAYDAILAIDTNTRIIQGKRCGICFSYHVPKPPKGYGGQIPYEPLGLFLIAGVAEDVNPERIGWHLTLSRHLAPYRAEQHGRLAIVVDSELGRHNAINARAEGYYGNHLLPAGASLIYASADTDKETLQGQMIRLCDAMATQAADAIEKADCGNLTHREAGDGSYEWSAALHIPRPPLR